MSKKKKTMQETVEEGEQLDLIDVGPENGKVIVAAARLYKEYQIARMAAGEKEVEQKNKVLELVHKVKLTPLAGGKIKFKYDHVTISVTPRDELVRIKEETEPEVE